jgi:hypothetical protein
MSKEAFKKEINQLCQSIMDSDLDQQASLMIHKMGKVYNHLLVYNYLNQQDSISEIDKPVNETIEKDTEVVKPEIAPEVTPLIPIIDTEESEEKESVKPEIILDKKEGIVKEEAVKVDTPEDKPAATVYERLATKQQLSIGLNDKFAFIRDLFDGNAEDFRKVMEEISKFNNAEEAKSFFSLQVATKHSWGEEQEETIQRFLNIIERRV